MPTEWIASDWTSALLKTLALMAVASVIAVAIGIPSAMAASLLAERSNRPPKPTRSLGGLAGFWLAANLFSIATPLILHAAAWESTAGKFGWLIKTVTGGNLMWVGLIHGIHGASIVAVAVFTATRRVPATMVQAARMDFPPASIWWRVRLPLMKNWLFAAVLLVWLLAATEMSVANLHSVRTLADQFYLFHALDPTFTSVAMTTWVPLAVGGIPAVGWYLTRRRRGGDVASWPGFSGATMSSSRSSENADPRPLDVAGGSKSLAIVSAIGVIVSMVVCQAVLLVGFVLQAGHVVEIVAGEPSASWSLARAARSLGEAPRMFATEYLWTLQLTTLTVALVVPTAWLLARTARLSLRSSRFTDLAAMVAFLIPGPIVSMAVVRWFTLPVPGFELLATETLVPTILAVSVRSGAVAYAVLRIGYLHFPETIWQSSRIDGDWRFRLFRIELPLMLRPLAAAVIAVAIIASGDVPATLTVIPPGVTTVGTRLFGLLHSGSRYQEASLAFWYLVGLLAIATVAWRAAALTRK